MDNVLVTKKAAGDDRQLEVMLADFGISVQLESKTATRTYPIGTFGYTAPEILKHRPYGL